MSSEPRDRGAEEVEQLRLENAQLLEELEVAYQNLEKVLGKTDRETQITYEELQKRTDKLQEANERIQASLREKEVLLKEVHHRVKNNLQIVSSLLSLQSRFIEDEQMLEVFNESQNRLRSMVLIHERLYQSEDLARVDFAEYVAQLATDLFRSYQVDPGNIRLEVDIDSILLEIDIAVPCGLIVNELVNNALKYAFPSQQEGRICIRFQRSAGGEFTMTVQDDGVGLAAEIDFFHTETLGLQLVNTLVKQLNGRLEVDCSGGTGIEITFPQSRSGSRGER